LFYQASDKGLAGVREDRATLKPQGRGSAGYGTGKGWGRATQSRQGSEKPGFDVERTDPRGKDTKASAAITVTWHKPEATAEGT